MLGIVSEDENYNKIFRPMAGATLGQGVPLGAWCSFEKDVAPSNNWLMAGTTFDATKYPALALYLGNNVVPSRYDHNRLSDWETLVADGTSNTWIDNYPNNTRARYYEVPYDGMIIILGKNRNIGSNNVIEISNDKGNTWEAIGWNYPNAGSTNTIPVKKGQYISAGYSEGVKFTSALGAFCKHPLFIKATSIASDSDKDSILVQIQEYNTYSTEEKWTGKFWIDGKKIYRKCCYHHGTVTDNFTFQLGEINIDNVVYEGGTIWREDSANFMNLASVYGSGQYQASISVSKTNNVWNVGVGSWGFSKFSKINIQIEYTKTTD